MAQGHLWKSSLKGLEAAQGTVQGTVQGPIPRILHHAFFLGEAALPDAIRQNIEGIQARNPGWEHRFYDAEAAEQFIKDYYGGDVLAIYRKIDPAYYAARADVLRYLICYAVGGVYLDVKSTAEQPFDTVLKPDDTFLIAQWAELKGLDPAQATRAGAHPELRHVPGFEYVQWFVISAPGHPFLDAVITRIFDNIERYRPLSGGVGHKGVLRLTGPIAYTLAIHPLRATTPHRYVDFAADAGLGFSLYGDHKTHRKMAGSHYSQQTLPIVQRGHASEQLSKLWFGVVQPNYIRVRRKLAKLSS